jgi:sigma-B regulation protein RsbU (phosphoserine phosphatase)
MDTLIVGSRSETTRHLRQELEALGYRASVAGAGAEVVKRLKDHTEIQLVVVEGASDHSAGMQLCRSLKSADWERYVYVLLILDARPDDNTLSALENESDDCLIRPFGRRDLIRRVLTGLRIIRLNEKLRDAREIRQIDLISGREAQERLLPVHFPQVPQLEIAARFIPSDYVSGDLYDVFRLDESTLGLYSIDVSGHGVAAALFSVGLSQRLTSQLQPGALLKVPIDQPPFYRITPPAAVLESLDEDDMLGKYGRYFTMVYAHVHLGSGRVSFCRAGHNLPLVIRASGTAEYIDGGGAPLGLGIMTETRVGQDVELDPGDAFILFSDGINETFSRSGKNGYGLTRVKEILAGRYDRPLQESFDDLISDAKKYQGRPGFADDISIIGFRWRGG